MIKEEQVDLLKVLNWRQPRLLEDPSSYRQKSLSIVRLSELSERNDFLIGGEGKRRKRQRVQGGEERLRSLKGRRGGGKSLLRRLKGLVLSSLWITMFPRICLISGSVCVCHYRGVCVCVCVRDVCCDIEAASFWSYYTAINISYQHGDYWVFEEMCAATRGSWPDLFSAYDGVGMHAHTHTYIHTRIFIHKHIMV